MEFTIKHKTYSLAKKKQNDNPTHGETSVDLGKFIEKYDEAQKKEFLKQMRQYPQSRK